MDSFGTEAQFNFNQYKENVGGGSMGAFGRYNLNLRQFQTMFRKMYSFNSVFILTSALLACSVQCVCNSCF